MLKTYLALWELQTFSGRAMSKLHKQGSKERYMEKRKPRNKSSNSGSIKEDGIFDGIISKRKISKNTVSATAIRTRGLISTSPVKLTNVRTVYGTAFPGAINFFFFCLATLVL